MTDRNTGEYSGFDYTPYLPTGDQPGEWLPEIEGELEMCVRGYHVCTKKSLTSWINANLYEVEIGGDVIIGDDKIVASKMRFVRKVDTWNDRTARLFACWCAEQVLPLYEKEYPNDDRPRKAIETSRRYANGEATTDELAAARDAAVDADNPQMFNLVEAAKPGSEPAISQQ